MIGSALQKAIFAALSGAEVCEGRVYDRVPSEFAFPYATIGDEQVIDTSSGCGRSYEVYADIHIWSRPTSGSKVELKDALAGAEAALFQIENVQGFELILALPESSRSIRDPDGLTEHGVLTFKFLLDKVE